MAASLPDFLFSGWRFRQSDVTEARSRGDLDGWTVSSLSAAYLKYQLDIYEEQRQANPHEHPPSLASISVRKVFESLRKSDNVHEEMKTLMLSMHFWTKDVTHTPYLILRLLDMSSATDVQGHKDTRKMIDIDEAILVGERRIRSQPQGMDDSCLVILEDLATIFGPADQNDHITIIRKTPPKGSFEFLDYKRKSIVRIQGSDTSFIKTFDRVTKNILKGLNWENVFVQGGMVLNTLLHTDMTNDNDGDVALCDIDLYLYDLTPQEANRKVEEISNIYSSNMNQIAEHVIIKTANTISFIPKYPERRVQIVLKLQQAPLESLLRVDLDACAIGFDGSRVFMLPRCARALETGYGVFTMDLIWGHRLGSRRETQACRVFKYANRGFGLRILPSYVRSLEKHLLDHVPLCDQDLPPAEGASARSYPINTYVNEPGLKILRRIACNAENFVCRYHFGPSKSIGLEGPRIIKLPALIPTDMNGGIPDVRNTIGVFEAFMRECAAWRLSAMGLAKFCFEKASVERLDYVWEVYDGLPSYSWDARATKSMESFKKEVNRLNNSLSSRLREVLAEKLQLPYLPASFNSRERYLTHLSRRVIIGDDIKSVQRQKFALPLVIPVALQTCIEEMGYRYDEILNSALSNVLIPVHDPSSHRPTTAMLPSLQDNWDERGNLRFWRISKESVWSGEHRALDEITELLLMLFSWFARKQGRNPEWYLYGTDHPHCIWYMADFFRRRLILPKASNALQRSQVLPEREAHLFRAWALTRPPRAANQARNHFLESVNAIEDVLEVEGIMEEKLFWQDGDEGSWEWEEGVPSWGDSEDTLNMDNLSI